MGLSLDGVWLEFGWRFYCYCPACLYFPKVNALLMRYYCPMSVQFILGPDISASQEDRYEPSVSTSAWMEVHIWLLLVNVFGFICNIWPAKLFLCGLGGFYWKALVGECVLLLVDSRLFGFWRVLRLMLYVGKMQSPHWVTVGFKCSLKVSRSKLDFPP